MIRRCGWLVLLASGLQAQMTPGSIASVAGTGINGYSGDGGPATSATIEVTYDIAADAWGNVYIADSWNHRVRKVATDGTISVFAGTGTPGFSGDGGAATSAKLSFPRGLAVDAWGNVYVSDSGNGVVRKIQTDGTIRTIAGNGQSGDAGDGGPALQASFRSPRGLAVDAKNNLYIADSFSSRIRRMTPDGQISTVVGNGRLGNVGDGGPATQANIGIVHSLAIDSAGNLYFTDTFNHSVRRVDSYGVIETIAGTGQAGFSGDGGRATAAALNSPRGLALNQLGKVYIADSGNHRIRVVGPDGIMSTAIGTGESGFGGDQGPAAQALVDDPYGLASDARGNVYVADLLSYRVRKARFELLQDKPLLGSTPAVNAAGYRATVSPGGLISVFGDRFGYQPLAAADAPLAPSIGGTSVMVNGRPAPVLFVSPGLINAQLPWNLTSPISLRVNFGGVESDAISVPVLTAAPGVFVWGGSRATALNADGGLNMPGSPAARGSTIMLYATGLGPVTPGAADGVASPSNPPAQTSGATSVLIGNVAARVTSSVMTPGYVGLSQVTVEIPANAPAGDAVPVKIAVGDVASNEATISVR